MRNKTVHDLASLRKELSTKDRTIHELKSELQERE
jgi:hypothetical protein